MPEDPEPLTEPFFVGLVEEEQTSEPACVPTGREIAHDGVDNDCDGAIDCEDADLSTGEWEGDVKVDQVAGFCSGYDCRSITGDLFVWGSDLSDLRELSCLISVRGDLTIAHNDLLTSLSGLDGLVSVGGDLSIHYNRALPSLSGLDGLASVGGSLHIGLSVCSVYQTYERLVTEPEAVLGKVIAWLGGGDVAKAVAVVEPALHRVRDTALESKPPYAPVLDAFYDEIHRTGRLSKDLAAELNALERQLVAEHGAPSRERDRDPD